MGGEIMAFNIDKLKKIESLSLTEEDIQKMRKGSKKIPDEWFDDLLIAVQNIKDAEDQREALVKNIVAISRIVLSLIISSA